MPPTPHNLHPRALPPTTTLLALCITGITLLTLLIISLTLLCQRHARRSRMKREERLGRVVISQTGPMCGDPGARDERDERGESKVEVNGGLWPPKDAEGIEGNTAEVGERNGMGEIVDARRGVGRGVKESRDVAVQVVEREKEDRGMTSLT